VKLIKRIILAVLVALTCFGTAAKAQGLDWHVGAKAGYDASWVPNTVTVVGAVKLPHSGFYAGVTADCVIGEIFLIDLEAIYASKGYATKYGINGIANERLQIDLGYVQFPLLFGVSLADNRFNLAIGPEFGILCNAASIYTDFYENTYKEDIMSLCEHFNIALGLQFSYMFIDNLGIDLKFDWGLNKTFNTGTIIAPGSGQKITFNYAHNISAEIGLCYKFGF